MGEPSLSALAEGDRRAVVFRLLWTPSFQGSVAVRVVASGEGATLHAVRLDSGSVYGDQQVVARTTVTLTRTQWAELIRLVDHAEFWSLPTDDTNGTIADGAGHVVEGVKAGRYHVVNAQCPRGPQRRYKARCNALMKLSGLDFIDLYKNY